VAQRSEEIEKARHLPADLTRELARAGVFRMAIPEALGGLELYPVQFLEVLEELSRADGSTVWCALWWTAATVSPAAGPEPVGRATATGWWAARW
jgi:alkylation response protein AidB-like acyl-CoA dehydrogenase